MCVCVSIKLKKANNAVGDLFFCVNLVIPVEWSCFFFISLNKMTNVAYENAMRRGPRN